MVTGKKLLYYREKNQLTQKELARRCHISATYISNIEKDKSKPSKALLEALCRELNVSTNDLKKDLHADKKAKLNHWYEEIRSRNTEKAKKTLSVIQNDFKDVDDPQAFIHFQLMNARYYLLIKDPDEAREPLQSVQKMKKYMDRELAYYYQKFSGLYEYLFGNLETALDYYTQARTIAEERGSIQPELLYQMALVYSRLQRNAQSIIHVHQALQAFSDGMNYERCIDCNMLMGINFNILEDYDAAESYFLKVIESADSHSESIFIKASAYHNLGHLYSKKKQHSTSVDCLLESLQSKSQSHNKANTFYLLAMEFLAIGQTARAREFVSKGLDHSEKHDDRRYKIKLKILEFELSGQTRSETFHDFLKEKALPYFQNKGDQFACECAELLGKYYADKALYQDSTYYFQLTNELRNKYKR